MTFYTVDAEGDYKRAPDVEASRREGLAPGVYVYRQHPMGDYLEPQGHLRPVPSRIYGHVEPEVKRFVTTYLDRKKANLNTGILLAGLKGAGKSLTTALVANTLIKEHGGVCILVDRPIPGQALARMIGSPKQPVMLDIDEYDKLYTARDGDGGESRKLQQSLLTFLSGGLTTGILSMLSVNQTGGIDPHLIDRPGRVFYRLFYKGLGKEVIAEYAKDNLKDQSLVEKFTHYVSRIGDVSFDILSSVVQEINRYDTTVEDALSYMGFGPALLEQYSAIILLKGQDITPYYSGTLMFRIEGMDRHHISTRAESSCRFLMRSDTNPYGLPVDEFRKLPDPIRPVVRKEEMLPLGDTGMYACPLPRATAEAGYAVILYDVDVINGTNALAVLTELGYFRNGGGDPLASTSDTVLDKTSKTIKETGVPENLSVPKTSAEEVLAPNEDV